jgi:primosomal protein N' (replication factor Y)
MILVNLNQDKNTKNNYFSNTLLQELEKNFASKQKSIIYMNKRWEFSTLICENCQHIFTCDNCDVSMNLHSYPSEKLICHVCNETKNIPHTCDKCHSKNLKKIWIGTQQVENFLKEYFSDTQINIFRFDTDVIKNKTEKSQALEALKNADIIIGTKMITTGFDFENVWLVAVMLLEQELLIPGYNTQERVYSNIKQLLGRGWRKGQKTNFVIQTFVPENPIVETITQKNYKDFFTETLLERKMFLYPPYCEMVTLEYRNKSEEKSQTFLKKIYEKLNEYNQVDFENQYQILMTPGSFKKHNQYYFKIIIKWNSIRNILEKIKKEIFQNSQLSVIFEQ